ncbi:hypothetical protein [Niallia sp. NCCP-28]|uniref:hypothetical protein n=1 Tax=Niallia sp. NCCP-28 TaxID=2934712 RepID=UPI002082A6B5|nr:hypothetical protein [Niallia sp. NCCP-28]GKU82610.1 hypothetical protein NCCP28_20060 [Niallia sp. NCCP-28]
MGLTHEFYLIPDTTELKEFYLNAKKINGIAESIAISDDIITYIYDSLEWIPSKNPATNQSSAKAYGFNYYGVTLFDVHSAAALKGVFAGWRDLFQYAPDLITLKGTFIYGEGNNQAGEYEKIIVNRKELLSFFDKIISMADRLAEGNYYVYHCGI